MEIIGSVIAAIAALAAIASAFIAHRQKKAADTAASEARADAAAATAAAQRAVAAAEESATAHTKLAEIAEAQTSGPPWRIEQVGEHEYIAINEGLAKLYDVTAQVTGFMSDNPQSAPSVDRGAKIRFTAIATMQEPHVSATITWAQTPGGAQREWSDQLT